MPVVPHLVVVPIVLPLVTAALLLLLRDAPRRVASFVNIAATGANLLVALAILGRVHTGTIEVYLASNWEAPFGIVLVADRLSALMLVLVGVVGLCAALYASAGWNRTGVYFHPLFQLQLMGLDGAFLTGDLFNLFVFFEVMLAASYGLQLHGSGWPRVRSGLHYIAVNLLASSLFLVGLAMFYGVMGTLNLADIAAKLPLVADGERGLLHAGTAVLAVAFLTKAAIWPLGAWLVPTYEAASAPVAALFAVMTKVGIYALLRLWSLFFSTNTGPSADFGATVLVVGGLATLGFAVLGLLASFRLGHIAGFSIVVSSGTLLAAIGFDIVPVTSAALFYMVSATLAASALFLLVELVERGGTDGEAVPLLAVDGEPGEDTNLDDDETALVGRAIPVSLALLGLAFVACTLVVAGLPPLSGFVAKFVLLKELLGGARLGLASDSEAWSLFAMLLVSGLVATVSLTRVGIRHFWSGAGRTPPRVKLVEAVAVLVLLLGCVALTAKAEPVLRYTLAAAEALHTPAAYVDAVLSTKPLPGPTRPSIEGQGAP